jgi:hypothetical protein
MSPVRHLTAILAPDVVGYSRLMGVDEVASLQALKIHRPEVVDPAISAHHGRTANAVVMTKSNARTPQYSAEQQRAVADLAITRPPFPLYAGDGKALENIRRGFHNQIPHLNRLFSCGRSCHEGLGQLLRLQLDKRSRCSVGQASNVLCLPYCSGNTSGIFWTEQPSF